MTSLTPTGAQVSLRRGSVTARIAQVGASLRHLAVDGVDLVPPYPLEEPTPKCSGVVLVPWPNRIRDGIWNDDGAVRRLAITEPELNNASHGLLRFASYEIAQEEGSATLSAAIPPQLGYPYELATSVTYTLTDSGIRVEHRIANRSEAPAPVALGTHPFVTIGDADAAELVLRVAAATQFDVDERLLPIGTSAAPDGLADGIRLADVSLDTGFADLARDGDGLVRHSLTAPDGRRVTLWQGEGFDYTQVYTTQDYPGQAHAVAIEPMTAPAEAFNSGLGLRRLAPGETWTLAWGIELS